MAVTLKSISSVKTFVLLTSSLLREDSHQQPRTEIGTRREPYRVQ
jgi:hypothetical protein